MTALRGDPELAGVVADGDAYLCLMHMQGEPRTMQGDPRYDDVASEVAAFLEERLAFAVSAGIPEERVCLDPGIGFGKTPAQNFELVRRLDVLACARPAGARRAFAKELARKLFDPEARTGIAGRFARCGGGGVRARRVDLPRPRRPRARGGADRGRGDRVIVELQGSSSTAGTERSTGSASRVSASSSTSSWRWARRAAPTGSRTRSTTALSPPACSEVSDGRAYNLLEALAPPSRTSCVARFPVERVSVRVRKPDVVLDPPVEFAAVRATRP